MASYAFDIEVFKNFFSVIFVDVENEFDQNVFIIFEDRDDSKLIKEFVNRDITLCGYNNIYFDNVLLNALSEGYSCSQLFSLSQQIIKGEDEDRIFILRRKKVAYKSLDFKEFLGADIGLKRVAVALEWDKIQDLPLPYDSIIRSEDVSLILEYNKNDVLPLVKLWNSLQPEMRLREKVGELYGVDVLTKSEGQIPNPIFEKLYSLAVNQPIKKIKEGRTFREKVLAKECLSDNIVFESNEGKDFFNKIQDNDLMRGFEFKLNLNGLVLKIGKGGLHSKDKPGTFYSDEDQMIIDADVTSFYPYLILGNSIKPAHLSNAFLDIYSKMTQERVKAKAEGDKLKAEILKITILAPTGKLNSENYWFYDPLAYYSMTLSGQLYLLSLIDLLMVRGFEVLSANTDGIVTRVPRIKQNEYRETCHLWEQRTKASLEYSIYERYIRRDGNNYIAVIEGKDKPKRKGEFLVRKDKDMSLCKQLVSSYKADIVRQALSNYFLDDVPVDDTLTQSKNIFDFLMSEKSGKNFDIILRNGRDEILQHTNRYYASLGGGLLIKKGFDEKTGRPKENSILAGTPVQIANDIDRNRPFEDYQVNLKYYKDEVMKVINVIEPSVEQLSLF